MRTIRSPRRVLPSLLVGSVVLAGLVTVAGPASADNAHYSWNDTIVQGSFSGHEQDVKFSWIIDPAPANGWAVGYTCGPADGTDEGPETLKATGTGTDAGTDPPLYQPGFSDLDHNHDVDVYCSGSEVLYHVYVHASNRVDTIGALSDPVMLTKTYLAGTPTCPAIDTVRASYVAGELAVYFHATFGGDLSNGWDVYVPSTPLSDPAPAGRAATMHVPGTVVDGAADGWYGATVTVSPTPAVLSYRLVFHDQTDCNQTGVLSEETTAAPDPGTGGGGGGGGGCSFYNPFCWMKEALTWAFVPGSGTTDGWNGFVTTLQSRPPGSLVVGAGGFMADVLDGTSGHSGEGGPVLADFGNDSTGPIVFGATTDSACDMDLRATVPDCIKPAFRPLYYFTKFALWSFVVFALWRRANAALGAHVDSDAE